MTTSKNVFLANKDDVKVIQAIIKNPVFEKYIALSRAEFSANNPTSEQSRGVSLFVAIMDNLIEDDKEPPTWQEVATSGQLDHNLEIPIRHLKPEDKK